ncbi:hypothetical protein CH92_19485 [Stutzerimonas stutzeri]|uniref:DUF4175 domain-containing protein n=1 Tax=Stutzerimonas stutzeri TaxID=316 RepID=W8RBS6_STUST|nr:hypothetical protein [Stutzerimonas stutzeri]AHL77138.1 hypothetical protein CH92_19485 [Stutzerimonas stutzeri]MCQ4330026.1 DUF4175 domain-containing protein [Stutzerimonas stutzeri]
MSWRKATFRLPAVIALLGLSGLFAALLGDGWWDALAWVGLGLPALLGIWPLICPRRVTTDSAHAQRPSGKSMS